MIKDPRVIALRKRFGFTEDGAANTIATLDAVDPLRVRGRSYVEWQRLDTYQHTDIKEHRTILIFIKDGGAFSISSVNPLSALRRMNAIAWAEQIQRPAWAETTPHADEPGILPSVESGGVQADGEVQGSPSADPSDDSKYLIKDDDEWWLAPGQGTTYHIEEAHWYPSRAAAEDAIREWAGDDDSRSLVVPALPKNSFNGRNVPAANAKRVHSVCMSRMVEMLLNEVDRDTLARMRRAAYLESEE